MNVLRIRNELRNGKTIFDLALRVTFYARVSTDKDEQLNSLENQVQYYTELIRSKPNWTYVEGYIDATDIIGTNPSPERGRRFVPLFCIQNIGGGTRLAKPVVSVTPPIRTPPSQKKEASQWLQPKRKFSLRRSPTFP